MKKSLLELDPQADALLILQCPNAQKITSAEDREAWDSGEASQSETTTSPQTDENNSIKSPTTYEDLRSLQPYRSNGDPNMIQFQVSTRHLCIVSPVFRAMIEGRYRESQPNSQGILEIGASDWNAEAFCILLDIIHGHH
ncbi:BTB/POZ domain [Fusarium oxysporum f. sp. vasinfectum]|nr:BTB/POZ domain [Fusarium oxysporum f. sp. vasinfectum]